jgi:hypothetical protein
VASFACAVIGLALTFHGTVIGPLVDVLNIIEDQITHTLWLHWRWDALLTMRLTKTGGYTHLIPWWIFFVVVILLANMIPDYCSLLETRLALSLLRRTGAAGQVLIVVLDGLLTYFTAVVWNTHVTRILPIQPLLTLFSEDSSTSGTRAGGSLTSVMTWLVFPALFTSVWLWMYAGSGFVVKAARLFDLGFQWFNRKFDIEKKPLQAIGLVAGSLVAIIYWGFALTLHALGK